MSETPGLHFQRFWSTLYGDTATHDVAFDKFGEQLAAFAQAAGQLPTGTGGAYAQSVLRSFQALGESASSPAVSLPPDDAVPAYTRFAAAAAELQVRLAQTNTAAAADVQAENTVRPPQSLQQLFNRWVDRYEQRLFELLTEPEFGATFGNAVNAALECYRDAGTGEGQTAREPPSTAELQREVEALAARIAELEAAQQ